MTDIYEVLRWLVAGGSVVAVSWLASWALNDVPWWAGLHRNWKQSGILVVSVAVAAFATHVLSKTPEELAPFMPFMQAVLLTVVAWLATQVAYKKDK